MLLDTTVVSEWASPTPNRAVQDWLNGLHEPDVFISAISAAEIGRGILLLPAGRRRDALASWFEEELLDRFGPRCLPVDLPVSLRWGRLMVEAKRRGMMLDVMDGLIAATAAVGDMKLVTRNTRHFSYLGLELIDPWTAS